MQNKILLSVCCVLSSFNCVYAQAYPPVVLQTGATIALPANASPCAIAVADFNADNRGDVAICEQGLNQVGVFLQNAAGAFPSQTGTYPAGIAPSGLVAVNLTNNPSRPAADLVTVSPQSYKWTLLLNDGTAQGTLTEIAGVRGFGTSSMSVNPQLVAGYLNRDGYVDFAYTYPAPGQTRVKWDGYVGAGQFSGGNTYEPPFTPTSLVLDDFDRDGFKDAAFTNTAGNEVWVIYATPTSNGSPLWTAAPFAQLPSNGQQPVDVAAGDLNRDLLPDLAVAHAGSAYATVFLNTGTATRFGTPALYALSAPARKVLLQDLNGDGDPELLAITADNRLQVFPHTGAAGITRYGTPLVLATGANPTTLQAADVNGDQVKDVVVGCVGDNTVRVYLNRSLAQPTAARAAQLLGYSAYPTPATDRLYLHAETSSQGPLTATLLDAVGRTVRQQQVQPDAAAIPVADLPRGVYSLRLQANNQSRVFRVVLQ